MKFSELQKELAGKFWSDDLSLDKRFIESRYCPRCRRNLVYKGYSNSTEYRAYGVCEPCDFARIFGTEFIAEAARTKKLPKRASLGIL